MSNFAEVAVEISNEFAEQYEANLKRAGRWRAISKIYRGDETTIYHCCSWNHYDGQLAGDLIPEDADDDDWCHCWIDEYNFANEGDMPDAHIYVTLDMDTEDYLKEEPKEE